MEKKSLNSSHRRNIIKLQNIKLNDCKIVTLKLVEELLDG